MPPQVLPITGMVSNWFNLLMILIGLSMTLIMTGLFFRRKRQETGEKDV